MRQPLPSLSGIFGIALLTGLLLPAALTWRSISATVTYRQHAQKTPYEYGFPIAAEQIPHMFHICSKSPKKPEGRLGQVGRQRPGYSGSRQSKGVGKTPGSG